MKQGGTAQARHGGRANAKVEKGLLMYIIAIVTLVCSGAAVSWAATSRPAVAAQLEKASGALLIAGLSLIGFALPVAQHLGHG